MSLDTLGFSIYSDISTRIMACSLQTAPLPVLWTVRSCPPVGPRNRRRNQWGRLGSFNYLAPLPPEPRALTASCPMTHLQGLSRRQLLPFPFRQTLGRDLRPLGNHSCDLILIHESALSSGCLWHVPASLSSLPAPAAPERSSPACAKSSAMMACSPGFSGIFDLLLYFFRLSVWKPYRHTPWKPPSIRSMALSGETGH